MSAAIDLLQREIANLKKVLTAQERGIPSQIAVAVKGEAAKTPEGRAEAVKKALAPYGLETTEDAIAAGCDVRVITLAWLREGTRNIPKPSIRTQTAQPQISGMSSANSLANGPQATPDNTVGSLTEGEAE